MAKGFDDYLLTAGDLLRGGRASFGLTIEGAAKATQIPVEIIFEIEAGLFLGQRSQADMTDHVTNYAAFLELDTNEITQYYWNDVARNLAKQRETAKVEYVQTPPVARTLRSFFGSRNK